MSMFAPFPTHEQVLVMTQLGGQEVWAKSQFCHLWAAWRDGRGQLLVSNEWEMAAASVVSRGGGGQHVGEALLPRMSSPPSLPGSPVSALKAAGVWAPFPCPPPTAPSSRQ